MSSADVLQPSSPEVSGATQAAASILNQMGQYNAEQRLQNLQLHSGGGSQETGTEPAIPAQQGSGSPATPINLTETMDDSDVTYAPTSDDEEDSSDSLEFIAETQVQEEGTQSAQLASPQSSQMLESHQVSAAAPVRDSTEDLADSELDAAIEQREQEAARLMQEAARMRAARRARQEEGQPSRAKRNT